MDIKQRIFGLAAILNGSLAVAGVMGPLYSFESFHPVIELHGGYASITANSHTQRFTGDDANLFTYTNSNRGKNTGFVGVFLGVEHPFPWMLDPAFFMQAGVEYNYFGTVGVDGITTVGIQPQTTTTYHYGYHFHTQHVLGILKLFTTVYTRCHPYGEAGLGAAFNQATDYKAVTTETTSLNLTPAFSNQNTQQFSYIFGIGIDTEITRTVRAGLGYRYSNFGSSALGRGVVTFNNDQSSVPFSITSTSNYANQLIARVSYVA